MKQACRREPLRERTTAADASAAMGKGRLLPLKLPRHARFRTRPLVVQQQLVGQCGPDPAGLAG